MKTQLKKAGTTALVGLNIALIGFAAGALVGYHYEQQSALKTQAAVQAALGHVQVTTASVPKAPSR